MEVHRIERICEVVRQGLDDHAENPAALESFLGEQHVTRVDVLEALEDVGRLDPEQAATARGLLEMVVGRLAEGRE